MSKRYETDVVIIGAGPVGLFAVFQCGMLGLRTHVIDALPEIGGQCTALYPEKPIYDIAGYPSILAGNLIDNLVSQAAPFDPQYHLNENVTGLSQESDQSFYVEMSSGQSIHCKAVFIAAGPGAFGPNKPPLEGIDDFENTSVHYMVRDKSKFAGKDIMIAGGGDSAVDWALSLVDVAKSVCVVHRRDKFRAAPESVAKLQDLFTQGRIQRYIPSQLKSIQGQAPYLNAVQIVDMEGQAQTVTVDHLLCFYGLIQNLGAIREWDLQIDGFHVVIDPTTGKTSRDGIYAMGDIATYPNKLKLIATGFAETAQAAHHAYGYIYPDQALHFEHSTTKGIPGLNDDTSESKG